MLPELAPEMDAIADESERQPSRPTDPCYAAPSDPLDCWAVFKVITDAGLKCGMTLRPTKLTRNPLWKAPETHPYKYFQKQLTFGGYIPNGYSGKAPLGSANWTADVKTTADIIIHKAKCKRIQLGARAFANLKSLVMSDAYNRWGCDMFYVRILRAISLSGF